MMFSSRLLLEKCRLGIVPKNVSPRKSLPPSFGMIFTRTPPVDVSAPIALVWNVISCAMPSLKYGSALPLAPMVFSSIPSTCVMV